MKSEETHPKDERRRYFRVRSRLPLRYRRIDPAERDALELEIARPQVNYEGVDPELAAHLGWLDIKLDRVLAMLAGAPSPTPVDEVDVEISGAGVSFACKEAVQPGTDALVELLIPSSPPRLVRAIGRAVHHTDATPDDPKLAIEFRTIGHDDRDAVVRFTHAVERSELRRRVEMRPGSKS